MNEKLYIIHAYPQYSTLIDSWNDTHSSHSLAYAFDTPKILFCIVGNIFTMSTSN